MSNLPMVKLMDVDINGLIERVDALSNEDAIHQETMCTLLNDEEAEKVVSDGMEERIKNDELIGELRALERAKEAYGLGLQATRILKTLERTDRLIGKTVGESINCVRTYVLKVQTAADTRSW